MKLRNVLSGFILLAVMGSGCSGTDFKKTKSGAPYKIISKGSGEKIADKNIVKFHITQKIKDSVLSTTYGQFPRYEEITRVPSTYEVRSVIMEVLLNARKGDSIYVTFEMDSFIRRDPTIVQNTPFRKGDKVVTTIRVLDVFKTPEAARADVDKESKATFDNDPKIQAQKKKDEKIIEDYLAANKINAQKTEWGVYVQTLSSGQGPKAANGKFAMVRYKGMDLAGKEFDGNMKPGAALLPVQLGAGRAVPGFEDAIRQLSKGAKARVFIPSVLAYGEMGSPPVIQPNQVLMFDLEIVDISDTPPQQQQPQMPDTTRGGQ